MVHIHPWCLEQDLNRAIPVGFDCPKQWSPLLDRIFFVNTRDLSFEQEVDDTIMSTLSSQGNGSAAIFIVVRMSIVQFLQEAIGVSGPDLIDS